ncbi:MAG: hypothetical protein U0031_01500 [Thermomicrobiales bacterium]
MDGVGFDRLVKTLAAVNTRRGVVARLAAAVAAGGGAMLLVTESEAGRRHRRKQRHRRNHDHRKGKRNNHDRQPPRGGSPQIDCRQPGNQGKICNDSTQQAPRRCCNGECFPYPDCVPSGKSTSFICGPNGDCRAADQVCCSGWGACEGDEGAGCSCALAMQGEGCASDWDCSDGICLCGICR